MAPGKLDTETGGRVRDARIAAGMTATEVALAAGVSRTTLWSIERGDVCRPHLLVRASIASVLGVAPETIFPEPPRAPDSLTAEGPTPSETSGAGLTAGAEKGCSVEREQPTT